MAARFRVYPGRDYPDCWRELSREFRRGKKCNRCPARTRLDTHHINRHPNDCRLDNLEPLCRPCHEKEHGRPFTDFARDRVAATRVASRRRRPNRRVAIGIALAAALVWGWSSGGLGSVIHGPLELLGIGVVAVVPGLVWCRTVVGFAFTLAGVVGMVAVPFPRWAGAIGRAETETIMVHLGPGTALIAMAVLLAFGLTASRPRPR